VQSKVLILCQSGISDAYKVAALEWYNGAHGYIEDGCPTLAICFGNGRCQFMRTELDDGMFNCHLLIRCLLDCIVKLVDLPLYLQHLVATINCLEHVVKVCKSSHIIPIVKFLHKLQVNEFIGVFLHVYNILASTSTHICVIVDLCYSSTLQL